MIVIRKWQLAFCDEDRVAAALLSFFEYWHNIKLEQSIKAKATNAVAQYHGDDSIQDESLWQFHTEENLENGVLIFKRTALGKAIRLLQEKGAITVGKNPNPRFMFDRTRFFLFHPEKINAWLASQNTTSPSVKSIASSSKSDARCIESDARSSKSDAAIPEITSEITPEIKENTSSAVLENSSTCGAASSPSQEMLPTAPEKPKPTKPRSEPWPEEYAAFADWLATQQLLTLITPPTDYDWWCDVSYRINGIPTTEWLEREYAGMQLWLKENPRKKPTPRGTSKFVRGWLERTYERERRQNGRQTAKELHIHYASNGRR